MSPILFLSFFKALLERDSLATDFCRKFGMKSINFLSIFYLRETLTSSNVRFAVNSNAYFDEWMRSKKKSYKGLRTVLYVSTLLGLSIFLLLDGKRRDLLPSSSALSVSMNWERNLRNKNTLARFDVQQISI